MKKKIRRKFTSFIPAKVRLVILKKLVFILLVFVFCSIAIFAQSVAFTNVNVIPMDKERVLQNQTVLIKNGMITEIGKQGKNPERRANH